MSTHVYFVYIFACISISILIVILILYSVHWCLIVRRHFLLVNVQEAEQSQIDKLSSKLFIEESNRVASCFGYVIFCAHPDSQNFSTLLLCHCKLIKFRASLLKERHVQESGNMEVETTHSTTCLAHPNAARSPPSTTLETTTTADMGASCSRDHRSCQAKSLLVVVNRLQSVYLLLASTESLHNAHKVTNAPYCMPFNYKCPICLVKFHLDEDIVVLSCQHGFHKECLNQSLLECASCPCCKSCRNMKSLRTGQKIPQTWKSLCESVV